MSHSSISAHPRERHNVFAGSMKEKFMNAAKNGATHVMELEVAQKMGREWTDPYRLDFLPISSLEDKDDAHQKYRELYASQPLHFSYLRACHPIEDFYGPVRKSIEKMKKHLSAAIS